jgi:hypothetical protein
MAAIIQLLNAALQIVGFSPKPWTAPALLGAFLLVSLPWIYQSQRGEEAVRIFRRAAHERSADRARMEAEALMKVSGNAPGLIKLAREALDRGRPDLTDEALRRLREIGPLPPEALLLERQARSAQALAHTVEEAMVRVERLTEYGMRAEAEKIRAYAARRWPTEPAFRTPIPQAAPEIVAERAEADEVEGEKGGWGSGNG